MSSGRVSSRSKGDCTGSNEDGDEEEEEEEKGNEITVTDTEKEPKERKALLVQFRKLQKLFKRSYSSSSSSSSPSLSAPPSSVNRKNSSLVSGKTRFGGGLCCCSCLSKPRVDENEASQGSVVPDDPEEFSYEYLKSLIEKNDFYSKECDTHFDD